MFRCVRRVFRSPFKTFFFCFLWMGPCAIAIVKHQRALAACRINGTRPLWIGAGKDSCASSRTDLSRERGGAPLDRTVLAQIWRGGCCLNTIYGGKKAAYGTAYWAICLNRLLFWGNVRHLQGTEFINLPAGNTEKQRRFTMRQIKANETVLLLGPAEAPFRSDVFASHRFRQADITNSILTWITSWKGGGQTQPCLKNSSS